MEKKKILILCASLKIGGAEKVAQSIALYAPENTFEFHYLVFHSEEGQYEAELRKKITDTVHKWEPHVEVSFGGQERRAVCHCDGSCCKTECTAEYDHEKEEHSHAEEGDAKKLLLRFGGGLALFLLAALLKGSIAVPLYLAAYLVFGHDVLFRAGRNILRGQVFDENFLMSVSTIGAIAIGELIQIIQ